MKKGVKRQIQVRAKATARKAQRTVKSTGQRVKTITSQLDRILLDVASDSISQLQKSIRTKSGIDIKEDIPKQLGEIILQKAQEVRKSLSKEELIQLSQELKSKFLGKDSTDIAKNNTPSKKAHTPKKDSQASKRVAKKPGKKAKPTKVSPQSSLQKKTRKKVVNKK